jgi:hypothetical protein
MIRSKFALCCAVSLLAAASFAYGAELPSKNAKPPSAAAAAKTCTVNGKPGVLAGDSGVCIKIGGYISGQIEAGNLKSSETLRYTESH